MTSPDRAGPDHSTPPRPPASAGRDHWAIGVAWGFGCIVMVLPLAFMASVIAGQFEPEGAYLGLMVAAVFGLCQWLFVLPLGLYLRSRKPDTAMGLWITAGIATLLNGACFGLMAL